jgi:hypothetical protein
MRRASLILSILLSLWAAGCDDGASPVTVTITTDITPPLVAFRDGLDGAWQLATPTSPTRFEAKVTGPYFFTVVCEQMFGEIILVQSGRTLDDEREANIKCDFRPAASHFVTGRMVQPGHVQIANELVSSSFPDWVFAVSVAAGTYDLMARTDDRILLRRAIAVTGDVALTPALDVLQGGAALATVAFTATNAESFETLAASVHLAQAPGLTPFNVYRGPIATAKVAPDSALVPTDAQTVSIQATAGYGLRALRRPFRIGGDTTYTLPGLFSGVVWEVEGSNISVSWTAVPEFDLFSIAVSGMPTGSPRFHSLGLDLSPRFLAETGVTRATVDTDLPGFKPEWRVDFGRQYFRDVLVQREADGELATSSFTEQVNPSGVRSSGAAHGRSELPRGLHGRLAHP